MIRMLIARELTISLRRGPVHVLLFVHASMTLGLVMAAERLVQQALPWNPPSIGASTASPATGLAGAAASDLGAALLLGLTVWLLILGVVVGPGIAGPAIVRERERGTLDMLLSMGARPFTIVFAKALAAQAQTVAILIGGLPAFGLVFVFGSVSPHLLLGSILLVFAWSAIVCAVSLCCSAWAHTTVGAIVAAFVGSGLILLVTLSAPFLADPVSQWLPSGPELYPGVKIASLTYTFSPFFAALALQPDLGQRLIALLPNGTAISDVLAATSPVPYAWIAFVVACVILVAPLLVVTSLRLRQ